ncbi:hypothetical protein L6452_05940 [Arctium lappa]|uniref:Uncharacterized protein n=1 Tax=Arctium lappa TaxID=4217 RepID=A0ACB9EHB0_ARCLA|nr:hypothetical protein L6452_05940 [Arctium lappa]
MYDVCVVEGLDVRSIKQLGGLDVLIELHSLESTEGVVENIHHGIHLWFNNVRLWSPDYFPKTRLVWMKIRGVPIQVWSEKTFKEIASGWGEVLDSSNCSFVDSLLLSEGKVLILTDKMLTISSCIPIKFNDGYCQVWIEEEKSIFFDKLFSSRHLCFNEDESSIHFDQSLLAKWDLVNDRDLPLYRDENVAVEDEESFEVANISKKSGKFPGARSSKPW